MKKKELAINQVPVPSDSEVDNRIREAVVAETEWGEATKKCFVSYKAAGEVLAAKKASLEHGKWLSWLDAHAPKKYRDRENPEAWHRTAQNWMRIAYILTHVHPALVESAQTVAQLFRLAQMIPEGGGAGGDSSPIELDPPQVVARLQRWIASTAPLIAPDRVREWPAEEKEKLRTELAPVRLLLEALEA